MHFNTSILGALIPIFIVILSGYIFRKLSFPGDGFWSYAERITYFVLFPALLLQKIATVPLDMQAFIPMVTALYAAVFAMTGLVFLMRPWRTYGAKAFTSFFQGSIRFNTYVGLSAVLALFGDEGLALAAVVIAVLIPLINLLCVTVLVAFNDSEKRNWWALLSGITRNPLIISCLAGILLNVSGIGLHSVVSDTLSLFGRASLPLGLLALGAGLDVTAARADGKLMVIICMLKLLVLPAFMWIASQMMNLSPAATGVAVLFAALPGSPLSFILAKQLGGDSRLMANIITVHVLISMLTLPVIMAIIIN